MKNAPDSRGRNLIVTRDLAESATRTINAMLRSLVWVLPVLMVAAYLRSAHGAILALASLFMVVLILRWVLSTGRLDVTIYGLVSALVGYGIAGVIAFGSVRSVASLSFVVAILLGGIFLSRNALIIAVVACIASLSALICSEMAGWLVTPDYAVSPVTLVVHCAVIIWIALNVYLARSLVIDALLMARDSENQLAKVFRSNPAALLRTSLEERRVLDINESYERMLGISRGEALGATTLSLDLWQDTQERKAFHDGILEGGVKNLPVKLKRRNGEVFEALISAEIIEVAGQRQLLSTVTDISELVRTRAALTSTEERLARIFRSSPSALIVTNFETRELISANDAATRMFGVPAEKVTGTIVGKFFADREFGDRLRNRLAAEGRITGVPARLLRANGESFEARISQELITEGGVRHTITAIEDVSEEYAAREALRASEERFSRAFRLSPLGMAINRLSDGEYLELSTADPNALGYTRDELIGRSTIQMNIWTVPEDRRRFRKLLLAQGQVSAFETRLRNKSGEILDCLIWGALMDFDGERCVLSCTINVTAQKRQQAMILDIAKGVSGETGLSFFRSLAAHLGRALQADVAIVAELISEERARTLAMSRDGAITANIEYAIAGTPTESLTHSQGLMLHEDGVTELYPRDAELLSAGIRGYAGFPLRDPNGKPIGLMSVASRSPIVKSDLTEALFQIYASRAQAEILRMRADLEIRSLNESLELRVADRTAQLQAANRELEAFSFSVSHDLRAPLRAIDGYVRILSGELGEVDDALREKAQARTLSGIERMNELIDDLIALARVSRQDVHLELVDLSAVAANVGARLNEQQREKQSGHSVELRVAGGLEARCDRALMRIVFENLLGNAWKFTAKTKEARVEVDSVVQPGGETAFCVRDNGAGFDAQYADRLFAPFQRLHSESEFEGTGIGLATVQRVVALHGGRVWATGTPGQGAAFYFTCGAT